MAAKQKHRMVGNPYNLCKKVEIPVDTQLEDDRAFLNKFTTQPKPLQVSRSQPGFDTDGTSSDISIGLDISGVVYSAMLLVHQKCRIRKSSTYQQKMLSQLDIIGKRLTVIENKLSSPAKPKPKNLTKAKRAASLSLKQSSIKKIATICPLCTLFEMIDLIKITVPSKLKERGHGIKNCIL